MLSLEQYRLKEGGVPSECLQLQTNALYNKAILRYQVITHRNKILLTVTKNCISNSIEGECSIVYNHMLVDCKKKWPLITLCIHLCIVTLLSSGELYFSTCCISIWSLTLTNWILASRM